MPHHPQIAIAADGTPIFAWDESEGGTRRVVVARSRMATAGDDRQRFIRTIVAPRGMYPAIAAVRDATVAAWTSSSTEMTTIGVARVR